jgi:cytochrome c-type biogenesis protein
MEYLQHLLDSGTAPFWTAIILGLMTAISPCPLATNITAIAFISKDIENKSRFFLNGVLYTLGRAVCYTSLGVILFFGASKFHVANIIQTYGERFLGPLLVVIGVLMLGVIKLKFPGFSGLTDRFAAHMKANGWSAFMLGILFALAFCPYSGVLYFGMLIPMSIASSTGLYLPFIYAVATGLPVIVIAWILAFSVSGIGRLYHQMKSIEKWFRVIAAITFILTGFYYSYLFYIKP